MENPNILINFMSAGECRMRKIIIPLFVGQSTKLEFDVDLISNSIVHESV